MNNHLSIVTFLLILNVFLSSCAERQVYIVYLRGHSGTRSSEEIRDIHASYLHSFTDSKEEAKSRIIYSYKNVINGFSALLTPEEAAELSERDDVVRVIRNGKVQPQTTRSWDFISLLEANWNPANANLERLMNQANHGRDIVAGVIDSGIWPESESFKDDGMGPIPGTWRGICETGDSFNSTHCNRKLVGARYYSRSYVAQYGPVNRTVEFASARDRDGHGTHAASILGGRRVANVSALGGFARGTASGGALHVRLAIYKVCWVAPGRGVGAGLSCYSDAILKAFDDAVDDGVQVISISLVPASADYLQDTVATGALYAVTQDIVVVACAGNQGPDYVTVRNVAPWMITVGASSIDRKFSAPVLLGNGAVLQGQSITPFQRASYDLVYSGDVEVPGTTPAGRCQNGTLMPGLVRGRAVFCQRGDRGEIVQALEVQRAGGAAAVLENPDYGIGAVVSPYLIPGVIVLRNETRIINGYINGSNTPSVTLAVPSETTSTPAPFVADFSSRGPSGRYPHMLKPDVAAPGLNILAAYSEAASPLNVPDDHRPVKYNILSGTSFACPHVAAVAVLLKAIHPDWSSAAIRSAIITTARHTNNESRPITNAEGNAADPFEMGAGFIQPSRAADPGLVYNASSDDYLEYVCSTMGGTPDPALTCDANSTFLPTDLNYPTLAIPDLNRTLTVRRTVTNVGPANSTYSVAVEQPRGYSVQISPTNLNFSARGQAQNFTIAVAAQSNAPTDDWGFGSYTWSDGVHQVRSPIALLLAGIFHPPAL